jgi:hypothetical protein
MSEINIPPDSPWVHNPVAGERVPPELNFLINRLATLVAPNTIDKTILEIAKKILWVINLIRAQRLQKQRKHQGAPRGYLKELEALRSAAKKVDREGGREVLDQIWATVSPESRELIWPADVARGAAKAGEVVGIRGGGFTVIAPPDPLPLIAAALKKPHHYRRAVDPLASELTDVIRDGYITLTGKLPPGRIKYRRRSFDLQSLARDIDLHFGLKFYLADGTHLRALRRIPQVASV